MKKLDLQRKLQYWCFHWKGTLQWQGVFMKSCDTDFLLLCFPISFAKVFCLFWIFCCWGFLFVCFFTSNWKAKNKLLYHDLSIAFSIGTLTVGYLSFCWEGIDFLSLLLGKPCFHLFHWLNVLIIRSQVYAWGVAPVMIKFSGQINTIANVCGT